MSFGQKRGFLLGGKCGRRRERGRESSNFSLRSMEIGWSSSDRPRFKVRVLDEGYALIPELPRDIAHASRGRETSYSGLFSIYESFWSCLSPRGCLVGLSSAKKKKKKLVFWDSGMNGLIERSSGWMLLHPTLNGEEPVDQLVYRKVVRLDVVAASYCTNGKRLIGWVKKGRPVR